MLAAPPSAAGQRLDIFLAGQLPQLTRSSLSRLIRQGLVTVNGEPAAPGRRLKAGDRIEVVIPPPATSRLEPEQLPLDVRYQDQDLLVINKPRGLAVHPGAGRTGGTLANALLARWPELAGLGEDFRPGLVHRLDKDTSGLMVVARNEFSYQALRRMVADRQVDRRYLALVWGHVGATQRVAPTEAIRVEVPIGRHPTQRQRMAALPAGQGRPAATEIEPRKRLGRFTLVEARLLTGRTHQIRVHLAYLGHPVVGDPVYGARRARGQLRAVEPELGEMIRSLGGQALHAWKLSFRHPRTGAELEFTAQPPPEMARLIAHLRTSVAGSR